MSEIPFYTSLPIVVRIVIVLFLAIAAHFVVRGVRQLTEWLLAPKSEPGVSAKESFALRFPKWATLVTILVSALTFSVYFLAVGLILKEFKVSMTKYLASASVIGLAIGFGSQGLVQDVVIGLTLIFSDALNIEDLVEISGQIGKVERIGLRFTTLVNIHGQKIYIPNRNIGVIGRFRGGQIRAYVDIQIPDELDEKAVIEQVGSIANGMHQQYKGIILKPPEVFGVQQSVAGNWRYLRVKFRLWPGQGALIETTFKQRVTVAMKKWYADYADWMVTVTYKVE